jgi:hypothetical protein
VPNSNVSVSTALSFASHGAPRTSGLGLNPLRIFHQSPPLPHLSFLKSMSLPSARGGAAAFEDDDIEAELQRALDAMESVPQCDIDEAEAEAEAEVQSSPRQRLVGGSVSSSMSAWTSTGVCFCF